ncbi:MAG: hypothetical protein Q9179_007127, partial [Wetmoreana sp. 5 TL-2023]
MAFSTKKLYQNDVRWKWKLVVRLLAVAAALVGGGFVASTLYLLRSWVRARRPGGQGNDEADMFILPWLLFTLSLSTVWNIANIITLRYSSRSVPLSANLACDTLLTLSLLASTAWLILAATTSIDGTKALDIHINGSYEEYGQAVAEILGIAFTFLTA